MITTTSPENAAALIALKTIVLAIPIGAVATYEQLSDAIGEDVRNKRWLINRAIRDAEEETGGLFETVRR